MSSNPKVRTCLWFTERAREAAEFYVSLLPNSHIDQIRSGQGWTVVDFSLAGAPYMILEAGPHHTLNQAVSISVTTQDQAETDRLWDALVCEGKESQCGWLTDRFGLTWQIVPKVLPELLGSDDKVAAARAAQAMMSMVKIDIAALEAAYAGK